VRRDDKGTVLVLLVLVLLALSAVAFVAVQVVTNQMARVGVFRVSMVSENVTAAGSEATMAIAAANPSGFSLFVQAQGGNVTMNDVSQSFFDTGAHGSFGPEATTMDIASWRTTVPLPPLTVPRAPGFESGTYCFRKYTAQTDGYYSMTGAASGDERNAQKRYVATLFVGPMKCE